MALPFRAGYLKVFFVPTTRWTSLTATLESPAPGNLFREGSHLWPSKAYFDGFVRLMNQIWIYKWGQFLHVWDWEPHIKGQYFGVTWASLKGSGGSKAIPCVIHQTAKTHTLNETCCNCYAFIVFTCCYIILYSYMQYVEMYVAYGCFNGLLKQYKKTSGV